MNRAPTVRDVAAAVRRLPVSGLLFVPAKVAGFAGAQALRARGPLVAPDELPAVAPTVSLLAQVAVDETILALMKRPDRYPTTAEIARVAAELKASLALHRASGWDRDPLRYHEVPPALTDPAITAERWLTTRFERLQWPSGYQPWAGLPGRDRWLDDSRNRTAHALVLRHREQRPWVVCLHGLGTGIPAADLPGFRVRHLHERLGFNVMLPVLPRHGPRGPGRLGAQTVLTYDHGEAVLAVAQAVWDVRRAVSWIHAQGGDRIALHGVSFGGLVASLLATLDGGYRAVVAGIPVVDIPGLFTAHLPWRLRRRAWLAAILGDAAAMVHRVISPLSADPQVPAERLFVYAGVGDRMVPPHQAASLARHWAGARTLWFAGDHVGAGWSREVRRFVDAALTEHLWPAVPLHPPGRHDRVVPGSREQARHVEG